MFNERYSFERYFFHHWAWLNMFMIHDKLFMINLLQMLNRQKKIYTIYICDTQSAQILEYDVRDVHGASSLYIKACWQSSYGVFRTWGMGESPHQSKVWSFTPSPANVYSLPRKVNSTQSKNKNVIFSCSNCSCTIFVLISYSFETYIMLILILIDAQYSQNAVFSFEKFSNHQNHSS